MPPSSPSVASPSSSSASAPSLSPTDAPSRTPAARASASVLSASGTRGARRGGRSLDSMLTARSVRDQIHGTIRLTSTAAALIDTPEVQRLRSVRQLHLAYLVYPNAQHTRFEHVLGAYHLMTRAIA